MARLPRLSIAGQLHLVVQRSLDGKPIFVSTMDHETYLHCLREAAATHRVAVHAYSLVPGEVRLLVTPGHAQSLARAVQSMGRRFVAAYNLRHGRNGSLWEGRFRATVVDAADYFDSCLRFVESAPVEAGFAAAPEDYRWSSAAHHAGTSLDPIVTEHPQFWVLGNTPFEREASYRLLMKRALTAPQSMVIRDAVMKGWTLGTDQFIHAMGLRSARRMKPLPRGRPKLSRTPRDAPD